jgi:CheY-like chemotaxis protein
MITQKYLSSFDYQCVTVDNGFDAIELFKNTDFDVVLMDINMPGINGIETTAELKLINHITPIIAFTAGSMAEKSEEYTVHGFSDLIIKPVSKENLVQVVERNIEYTLRLSSIA